MIKLILRKGREESLRRFHPWVFSGAVAEIQGRPAWSALLKRGTSDLAKVRTELADANTALGRQVCFAV